VGGVRMRASDAMGRAASRLLTQAEGGLTNLAVISAPLGVRYLGVTVGRFCLRGQPWSIGSARSSLGSRAVAAFGQVDREQSFLARERPARVGVNRELWIAMLTPRGDPIGSPRTRMRLSRCRLKAMLDSQQARAVSGALDPRACGQASGRP
jgi:hypothetical protein